jgi:hypothetical protein
LDDQKVDGELAEQLKQAIPRIELISQRAGGSRRRVD